MRIKIFEIAAIGLFSALAYAGGYLFITIPNIEIFTAIIFIAGVFLGKRNGLLVGVIAQSLYSIFNPWGISPLPLFVAQVLNRAFVGFVGGWYAQYLDKDSSLWLQAIKLGAIGLVVTWLYDLMAFSSLIFISGFTEQGMKVSFMTGLPFYLIHGFANTMIFAFGLPFLIKTLKRMEAFKALKIS